MKTFAIDLAAFLRRHYPDAIEDGWYRFSADLQILDGQVEVHMPMLSRLSDESQKGRVLEPRDASSLYDTEQGEQDDNQY